MRLHRLEIEGFGPFRDRQIVDFDGFADDGIFLIAGRTGAGKSSILDAVCFALYGGVPRYDGGEKRLRSDHCAPDDRSEVVVEFSTAAGRFRVTRSPEYERPKKRGSGMVMQKSEVLVEQRTEAGWQGLAARAVDAGHELAGILQLTQDQFLQVILLAQNRFARFLLADSNGRRELLRKLFDTGRFEDLQRRFDDRRKESEQRISTRIALVEARLDEAEGVVSAEQLGGDAVASEDAPSAAEAPAPGDEPTAGEDAGGGAGGGDAGADPEAENTETQSTEGETAEAAPGTIEARLALLRRARRRAEERVSTRTAERADAERASTDADAAFARVREVRAAQEQRDRARQALLALDTEAEAIDAARAELARAQAAESLRGALAAAERAEADRAEAAHRRDAARDVWSRAVAESIEPAPEGDPAGMTAEDLRIWAAARTRELGGWEDAAALEAGAADRAGALTALRDEAAEQEQALAERTAEQEALPGQIAQHTTERDEARRTADRADAARADHTRAEARLGGAEDAARLAAEQERGERELSTATDAHAQAQQALAELRRRRLAGIAGELAADLHDDDPCPVCGSTAHPAPAAHNDPVVPEDVDAAEAARDAADAAERRAEGRVAAIRAELAAAQARAEGRDVAAAAEELAEAERLLAETVAAADRAATAQVALDELAARAAAAEAERAAAAAALAATRESLAAAEQAEQDAASRVARARGTHTSVAARIDEVGGLVAAAQTFADALDAAARNESTAAELARELAEALAASAFDDADAARAALRSSDARAALHERITAHDVHRETERARLDELEARELPDEPVDTASAEAVAQQRREAWASAVDAAARAENTLERLGGLIDTAASEHAAVAALIAEHEVLRALADTIAGRGSNTRKMALETFVLAAELEDIVGAANQRLADMSAGRYRLQHSDGLAARGKASGLGIVVYDAFTGQERPAQSLSGGETFLSSLALALGLAEVVTARAGGVRLDTLFIDEGFGSLDADTLEVAMRTLDELRAGGRTVGVISHVETMQEQIPAQLRVEQTEAGPSRIVTPA